MGKLISDIWINLNYKGHTPSTLAWVNATIAGLRINGFVIRRKSKRLVVDFPHIHLRGGQKKYIVQSIDQGLKKQIEEGIISKFDQVFNQQKFELERRLVGARRAQVMKKYQLRARRN